jgi:hypothetical protein
MAFDSLNERVDAIQEDTKVYVEKTLAYYKLWGFKVAMKSTTMIVKFLMIGVFLLFFVLFASIAVAFALGDMLGETYYGFLIVAGFYLLCTFLFLLIKISSIEGPLLERFSEIFFND